MPITVFGSEVQTTEVSTLDEAMSDENVYGLGMLTYRVELEGALR